MDSQIARIRASCSIAWAWWILGLPGAPAKECKSPFREDKRPSFSVYRKDGWERWWDYAEGAGGDVIDLWARAKGVTVKEALSSLIAMAGTEPLNRPPEAFLPQGGVRWPPDLRTASEDECRALGALRNLSPEAFYLAGRLGTLKVATIYSQKCWIITDCNARCAEARRFDGQLFPNGKKGFCLPGSKKDMPIGLKTLNPQFDAISNLLLVEGMPDYYAALQLASGSEINFKVLAILGASTKTFHADCLPQFVGAQIVVIPHNDRSGRGEEAARFWGSLFNQWGARNVVLQKLPIVCDDLNDFLLQRPCDGAQLLKKFHNGSNKGCS